MTRIFMILFGLLALSACDYGGGYSNTRDSSYSAKGY